MGVYAPPLMIWVCVNEDNCAHTIVTTAPLINVVEKIALTGAHQSKYN